MEFKDYYAIMGLTPEATPKDIKHAYHKLARKYHPDVSQEANAEEKFKGLGEAYEVLKDKEKRDKYDRLRQQGWKGGEQFSPPPHWQQRAQQSYQQRMHPEEESAFSDFFESLFGGIYRSPGSHGRGFDSAVSRRGEDIYYILKIDLQDAYSGATKKIEIPINELIDGRLVQKRRNINVKIPKGVIEGQQIRLKGQGGPGYNEGPSGDLYLEIRFNLIDPYHISGRDITLYLPVSPWEAALGFKVKAPTLGGPIEVKIPTNSQTGTKLRLKGRGLPGKQPGDQYIILQIVTPPANNELAKGLYQEMADKIPFNPREKLGI